MGEWARVNDVAARYEGVLDETRRDWVEVLIADAENVLRDELPGLPARLSDGRTSTETVIRVVAGMVLSVLRNPSGYTQQTAGEFSYSYAGNPNTAGGVLRLSAQDRRALIGRPGASTLPASDPALTRPMREDHAGRARFADRYGRELR